MGIDGEEAEANLLDVLVVVAENLKLLFLGPLIVGLVAWGIVIWLPQSFTSEALLALPTPSASTQAASMMVSPVVLDPVIDSQHLSEGRPVQVTREALAKRVKATLGKDGLLHLDVTVNSPTGAQSIANAIIDTWLKTTVPGKGDREDLEKRLVFAQASLNSVNRLLDRLTTESAGDLTRPAIRGELGTSIVAIGELRARYQDQVLSIPHALQGLSRDVVKQAPTLPTEPIAPKKTLVAVFAALGSGFFLLLWVFVRHAWKNAARDPRTASKQAQLLAALGLGTNAGSSP